MSETMVERVARALFQKTDPKLDWDNSTDFMKRETRDFARAAIEAMREPTDAMILPGYNALMEWDARTGEDNGIADIYNAMIDAALPPSTRGE